MREIEKAKDMDELHKAVSRETNSQIERILNKYAFTDAEKCVEELEHHVIKARIEELEKFKYFQTESEDERESLYAREDIIERIAELKKGV